MKIFINISIMLCQEQYITQKILKNAVLWLPSSFLSGDIGSFNLIMFSVKQKDLKPANSLLVNNNQITNWRSVIKLWLRKLLLSNFMRLEQNFVKIGVELCYDNN